jgi:MoaA/NifB/PqqE/SkfB family radical SAM enzyme
MLPRLHIEPTTRCTLGCPRCGRTVLLEKFGKKSLSIIDLDPSALDEFIDVNIATISLCGNNGDPIYHKNLKDLIKVCKKHSEKIVIKTNGGHRTKHWWAEIVELFEENDEIHFSIDGTPENFTKYRINGDWNSTLIGINQCVSSKVKTIWKYIPFSFNENDINTARNLATDLGFDRFWVDPSDRWEDNDWLKPKTHELIGSRSEVRNNFKYHEQRDLDIDPKCKTNHTHFINANGHYMPCCMMSDYRFYYKSQWWKNKDQYDIKTTKLSQQLTNFNEFYKTIHTNKPDYCLFTCGKC